MTTTTIQENTQEQDFDIRFEILSSTDRFLAGLSNAKEAVYLFDLLNENVNFLQVLPSNMALYLYIQRVKKVIDPLEAKYSEEILQILCEHQDVPVSSLTSKELNQFKNIKSNLDVQKQDPFLETPLPNSALSSEDLVYIQKALKEKEMKNFVDLTGGSLLQAINLAKQEIKGDETEKRRTKFIYDDVLVFQPNKFLHGLYQTFTRLHPEVLFDLTFLLDSLLGLVHLSDLEVDLTNSERTKQFRKLNQNSLSQIQSLLDTRLPELVDIEAQISDMESKIGNTFKRLTLIQRKPLESLYISAATTYILQYLKDLYTEGRGFSSKIQLDFLLFAHRVFEGSQRFIHNPRRLQTRGVLLAHIASETSISVPTTLDFLVYENAFLYYLLASEEEDFTMDLLFPIQNTPQFTFYPSTCANIQVSGIDISNLKSRSYFFYADITSLKTVEEHKELLDYLDALELNGFYFLVMCPSKVSDSNSVLSTWLKSKPARYKVAFTKGSECFALANYNFEDGISIKDFMKVS